MIWRCDLTPQYQELKADIHEAIERVLSSGVYVLAKNVAAFEEEFIEAGLHVSNCSFMGDAMKISRVQDVRTPRGARWYLRS